MTFFTTQIDRVPVAILLFSLIVLSGCSTVPVDRVSPDRLTVNVEYVHQPEHVEVDVWMRAGFWQRRVGTGDAPLVLHAESGQTIPFRETDERGRYRVNRNPSEGPFTLQLANFEPLTLPMTQPVRLLDPNQHRDTTVGLTDRLTVAFENTLDAPLRWEYAAQCRRETFVVRRNLPSDAESISLSMETAKQQLDRTAQARLLGQIPLSIILYETYDVPSHPPFRIRKARAQDTVDVILSTPSFGVSVSGSVSLQVSSNAFVGLGASTLPTERCL